MSIRLESPKTFLDLFTTLSKMKLETDLTSGIVPIIPREAEYAQIIGAIVVGRSAVSHTHQVPTKDLDVILVSKLGPTSPQVQYYALNLAGRFDEEFSLQTGHYEIGRLDVLGYANRNLTVSPPLGTKPLLNAEQPLVCAFRFEDAHDLSQRLRRLRGEK